MSVAAAFLLVVAVIAVLTMTSTPKHGSQAALAATPPGSTTASPTSAPLQPSTPSPTPLTSAAAHTTPNRAARPVPSTTPTSSASNATSTSQDAEPTSPAGPAQPGVTYQGVATEYSAADGNGACLFGPSDDMMIAAMNERDYQNSEACGAHVLVRAANGATVTVLITNECPYPCAPGQLDLSRQAFAKIADPSAGRVPITWQLTSPTTSDTISIRYKTGSSQYWCGIQVIGERNPVIRLEANTASGWHNLPRTGYNYFLSTTGTGCDKPLRITDIYGQQLTTPAMPIKPDVAQPARIQFAQH